MAKLTTAERKSLKKSEFAIPSSKKYPINDKSHAANAKARASQMEKAGKISSSSREKIFAAANKVLKSKKKS